MPFCKSALATLPLCRKTQCCFFLALELEQGSDCLDDDLNDPEEYHDQNGCENHWQARNKSDAKRLTQFHLLRSLAGNVATAIW
jgi:hypothetical protein